MLANFLKNIYKIGQKFNPPDFRKPDGFEERKCKRL